MEKWTDSVSNEEWAEWTAVARRHSVLRLRNSSLGPEEYAARAIEKLLKENSRPPNIEAWLRLVINRQSIDRHRKIETVGRDVLYDGLDEELEARVFRQGTRLGLSNGHVQREEVERVMSVLGQDEYAVIMRHIQGHDNHEIADEFGYKSNRVAATRIAQIKKKIVATIGTNPLR